MIFPIAAAFPEPTISGFLKELFIFRRGVLEKSFNAFSVVLSKFGNLFMVILVLRDI